MVLSPNTRWSEQQRRVRLGRPGEAGPAPDGILASDHQRTRH
jgi:hypothetical protein